MPRKLLPGSVNERERVWRVSTALPNQEDWISMNTCKRWVLDQHIDLDMRDMDRWIGKRGTMAEDQEGRMTISSNLGTTTQLGNRLHQRLLRQLLPLRLKAKPQQPRRMTVGTMTNGTTFRLLRECHVLMSGTSLIPNSCTCIVCYGELGARQTNTAYLRGRGPLPIPEALPDDSWSLARPRPVSKEDEAKPPRSLDH
jgi:hypothetical protein